MEQQKDELLSAYTLAERNEILVRYANYSFAEALEKVKEEYKLEKDSETRLSLLAAKSWILRKKLYAILHDPYISALSEVEDTNIFDGLDEEDYNEFDSLFEDEDKNNIVSVTLLKATTIDGKKIPKDTKMEMPEEKAQELINEKKAKLSAD